MYINIKHSIIESDWFKTMEKDSYSIQILSIKHSNRGPIIFAVLSRLVHHIYLILILLFPGWLGMHKLSRFQMRGWLITFFIINIIFIFSCRTHATIDTKIYSIFLFRCLELKYNENKLINIFSLNAFYIGLTIYYTPPYS